MIRQIWTNSRNTVLLQKCLHIISRPYRIDKYYRCSLCEEMPTLGRSVRNWNLSSGLIQPCTRHTPCQQSADSMLVPSQLPQVRCPYVGPTCILAHGSPADRGRKEHRSWLISRATWWVREGAKAQTSGTIVVEEQAQWQGLYRISEGRAGLRFSQDELPSACPQPSCSVLPQHLTAMAFKF